MRREERKQRHGFTLIEVLIVVVILGILAATVLPQFTSASDDAKESAVIQNLQLLRSQVQMYKFQHEGRLPTAVTLEEKLTRRTDIDGTTNDASGKFGPYITGQLPPNPFNGERTITGVTGAGPVDRASNVAGTAGWVYNEDTGEIFMDWDQDLVNPTGVATNFYHL